MILENKIVKMLNLRHPRNIRPSEICMSTVLMHCFIHIIEQPQSFSDGITSNTTTSESYDFKLNIQLYVSLPALCLMILLMGPF